MGWKTGKKNAFHIDEVRDNCGTGITRRVSRRGLKTVKK